MNKPTTKQFKRARESVNSFVIKFPDSLMISKFNHLLIMIVHIQEQKI